MRCTGLFLLLAVLRSAAPAIAEPVSLDDFEDVSGWTVTASDGVTLRISQDDGVEGRALRLDFDFARGSGFCIARRDFDPPLLIPANYRFDFHVRADAPRNNFEFKMIDPTGDNVWWVNQRDHEFPTEWTRRTVRARHVSFAWGPSGGKPLGSMAHLEFAIAASQGGKGTIWLDELTFEPLPEARPYAGTPAVRASSTLAGAPLKLAENDALDWSPSPDDPSPWVELGFGEPREFGGLSLAWDARAWAPDYDIVADAEGAERVLARVRGSNGGTDHIYLPESEATSLRLRVHGAAPAGVRLLRFAVRPLEFSASPNDFFRAVAAEAPAGRYPRYLRGEQSYWTAVGAPDAEHEALVNEDGAIEPGPHGFSVEPFLWRDGELISWNDAERVCSYPIPGVPNPLVEWRLDGLRLAVSSVAVVENGRGTLDVSYDLALTDGRPQRGTLLLAIRPFQVNPPWQNLNVTGGVGAIRSVSAEDGTVLVNGRPTLAVRTPVAFGAVDWARGDISEHLGTGELPEATAAEDPHGFASAALAIPFDLGPRHPVLLTTVRMDLGAEAADAAPFAARWDGHDLRGQALDSWLRLWLPPLRLPTPEGAAIVDSLRTALAHILVNADGPAIQPGSRCYDRTWIRDGCLTSTALLSVGQAGKVREFLDWFAPFQYDSGKIPCCVDARGPDPVPEHDSHGEYIYAVATYHRFTGDTAFLRRHWPHVQGAVRYIEHLRAQRMTDEYARPDRRVFYGLLPESISHEGYSAKPMHSYWDGFWTVKGLSDAAYIALVLGEGEEAERLAAFADDFRRTLYDSMRLSMKQHGIDYIPGCAELGDFDATSTTVGIWPCDELGGIPEPQLRNTFERYWAFFQDRRDGRSPWEAYTPYETRVIGAFVRLGQRERALEAARWFMQHHRPSGWHQWAEVVWNDPAAPKFIGDMPHTWVGSDFINSVRAMLVHETPADDALVMLAGVPESWLRSPDGLVFEDWPTHHGRVSCAVSNQDGTTEIRVRSDAPPPPRGIVLSLPSPEKIAAAAIGDRPATLESGAITIRELPATVRVTWKE